MSGGDRDPAIEVRGVTRRLGNFRLSEVDLVLPRGYVMGFVGPNGAGKTTTIKAVLGMIHPEAGTVRVLGRPAIDPGLRSRIGFVADQPFLVPEWRAPDAAAALAPFYPRWDGGRFDELTRRFEVPRDTKVKDLSRGQGTKLMLALALAHDPELLVLDEPTSGLDPLAREDLLDVLREFMLDERRSVLFSTHITSDLEKIADHVEVICAGRVTFAGTRDEMVEQYAVVRGGPDTLTPQAAAAVLGRREGLASFEGLIWMRDSALFGPDTVIEPATIEDVVTHLGRDARRTEGALR